LDIWGPKFEKIWDKCQNLEILKSEAKIWKNLEKFGSKFLTVPAPYSPPDNFSKHLIG